MDKEYIKTILTPYNANSDYLIKDGDTIDEDLVDIFMNAKISDITKAFYVHKEFLSTTANKKGYFIKTKCPKCQKEHLINMSKTKTLEYMRNKKAGRENREDVCLECKSREEERKRYEKEISARRSEIVEINTRKYIENYLDPRNSFREKVNASTKIKDVMEIPQSYSGEISNEKVRHHVLSMEYSPFLNTPYWDAVRNYKLKKANYRCELCNAKAKLNVHHKTYEHHGQEHFKHIADKDLIVLCEECHAKFHDKLYTR